MKPHRSPSLTETPIYVENSTEPMRDYKKFSRGDVTVMFRNLEEELIAQIRNADFVVGCIAWLTNTKILEALRSPQYGCAIVVQKEDFLRPETPGSRSTWKRHLRDLYDQTFCGLNRYDISGLVGRLSLGGDSTMPPIRCVGNHNKEKSPAFPRMHNKFLVFCKVNHSAETASFRSPYETVPYAVWTGSCNFSETAMQSFENAVLIESHPIANAYFNEWGQITALSEPLDWSSEWIEPEWRVGT